MHRMKTDFIGSTRMEILSIMVNTRGPELALSNSRVSKLSYVRVNCSARHVCIDGMCRKWT